MATISKSNRIDTFYYPVADIRSKLIGFGQPFLLLISGIVMIIIGLGVPLLMRVGLLPMNFVVMILGMILSSAGASFILVFIGDRLGR